MAEEPSAAPEVPAAEVPPADVPAADVPAAGTPTRDDETPGPSDVATPDAERAPGELPPAPDATDAPSGGDAPDSGPDVGALFEKLRSVQVDDAPSVPEPVDAPDSDAAAAELPGAEDAAADEDAADDDDEAAPGATTARDAALAEATDDLVRRGKRALQDEQNDILDGLRRQRGKIDTTKVLPSLEDQLARWAHVLQPAVDTAYAAGADSAGGSVGAAPRALLTELATGSVAPLRDRLAGSLDSIDARTPADTEIAIAQSLGARYREWRGEQLEQALGDALAVAYSRGVYDAAPDGARLRWVPATVGKCPDCDDNALEPTVKGSDFPTGQPHPPAHPGCRCVLVLDPD
jgi:hypothetical protein